MVENDPRNNPWQKDKDGDENMDGMGKRSIMAKRHPNEAKPVKIYPFTIDKLSEENARYWFHTIRKQMMAQHVWEAIEMHAEVGNEEYMAGLSEMASWREVDLRADMIIEHGLTSTTVVEVKDQLNTGEKWEHLKRKFLKSSRTRKMMKLMNLCTWTWDKTKDEAKAWHDLMQMVNEFKELHGGKMLDIDDLSVLWYLRGLGDDHATFRETLINSDKPLTGDYVLDRVEDHMQWRKQSQKENASRASQQQGKPRGPKCYSCQGFGHKASKCANQENDKRDHSPGNENQRNSQGNGRGNQRGRGGRGGQGMPRQSHRGRAADDDQDLESPNEEYGGRAVDNEESCGPDGHSEARPFVYENAYRSSGSQDGWVFDSGATSMSTGDKSIFEYMDPCQGNLTIASGVRMPIRGRGIVRFDLAKKGQQARLGGVIYVPGLAENLLSLEALHLAGYESRGSSRGYELSKDGKTVAFGKRIGRSTYLDSVKHEDTLLVGPDVAKRTQYA